MQTLENADTEDFLTTGEFFPINREHLAIGAPPHRDCLPPHNDSAEAENEAPCAECNEVSAQRRMTRKSRKIEPVQPVKEPPIGAPRLIEFVADGVVRAVDVEPNVAANDAKTAPPVD